MSKLPALTSKRLIKILEKSGFQLDHKTGSHFIFYHSSSKRITVVPQHNKDLPKGTLLAILKQSGVTKEELRKYL